MCYEHFEYLVVSFDLTNAPATFQSYINCALCGLVDNFCIVYLDNILVFSKLKEEHQKHLKLVIKCLYYAELYMNLKKCNFFQFKVEYLEFIIDKNEIHINSAHVKTILK